MGILSFLKKRNKNETTKEFISRLPFNEEVDPVAEASIYMAYGRVDQAREILLIAQLAEPDRMEIKLLLSKLEDTKEDIKNETVIFSAPNIVKNKVFLINLMVATEEEANSYPDNFKFSCAFDLNTKEGQDLLFKEIDSKGYKSWALISFIELKT
jgi:hypothetical protein